MEAVTMAEETYGKAVRKKSSGSDRFQRSGPNHSDLFSRRDGEFHRLQTLPALGFLRDKKYRLSDKTKRFSAQSKANAIVVFYPEHGSADVKIC